MQKDRSRYITQTTYTLPMCRNLLVADINQSLITMETLFTEGFTVVSLPNELCSVSYEAVADRKEIRYVIIKQVICLRVFLSNVLSLQFIGLFVYF